MPRNHQAFAPVSLDINAERSRRIDLLDSVRAATAIERGFLQINHPLGARLLAVIEHQQDLGLEFAQR